MAGRDTGWRWGAVFAVLVLLAVPWFLWRDATVVAGLPVWIWWHVAWMFVAAATFAAFADRAWGMGIGDAGNGGSGEAGGGPGDPPTGTAAGEDG